LTASVPRRNDMVVTKGFSDSKSHSFYSQLRDSGGIAPLFPLTGNSRQLSSPTIRV
jgi:hypothetical protein